MPVSAIAAYRLARLQSFKEAVLGTSAAATAAWMGVKAKGATFKPTYKQEPLDEQRGSVVPAFIAPLIKKGGTFKISGYATYEDLLFLLSGGMQGALTPTPGSTVNIVSSTNATPIVVTATAHGVNNGDQVFIAGHTVNTNANGGWIASGVTTNTLILTGSVGNGVGGATGTVGKNPFTWSPVAGSTSAWNAQSYTFEWGYGSANTVQAAGCVVTKWSLKGQVSKPWEYDIEGFYLTHNQNVTLTAAIADRVVEAVLLPSTALAIDPAGTAYGTTPYASTLIDFQLDVDTGLKPVYTGGALAPIGFVYERLMPKLKLNALYTAAIKTLLTGTLFSGTGVGVQLKATSGSKSAEFDFSGNLIADVEDFADKEGALTVPMDFEAVYDAGTPANYLKSIVTNLMSFVP